MNKKIFSIVASVIVVISAAVFYYAKNLPDINTANETTSQNQATTTISQNDLSPKPVLSAQPKPKLNIDKELAWATFLKYLIYNKSRNLDGVKSVVYKVSAMCNAAIAGDECKDRMDMAYSYGSAFKKDDFVNVWSDGQQTILSTNFKIGEDDQVMTRTRSIIFFVGNGLSLKLLGFSPDKGAILEKTASTTKEELIKKLIAYTEDGDQDGISDYDEQCSNIPQGQTCIKTDPKLRDTNSNGLWDGVEALMK
jgi:hypothetical protein